MKIIYKKKSETGFTLIEVMMALTVFSVGIMAVASMQLMSMQSNSTSVKYTEASQLAANLAEEINLMPYSATAVIADSTDNGNNGEVFATTCTVGAQTNYGTVANPLVARQVTVNVAWNDRGISRNVNYTFIKSPAF